MSEFKLPDIPEEERTPVVSLLLAIIQQSSEKIALQDQEIRRQSEKLQLQSEAIQSLRDEIARLKTHKPEPELRPSSLEKKTENKNTKREAPKKKKTKKLKIHRVEKCYPDNISWEAALSAIRTLSLRILKYPI